MKGHTHLVAGACAALPVALATHGLQEPLLLGVGAVAALLPDLDHPQATLGRRLPWPARTERHGAYVQHGRAWFGGRTVWHRGPTHSLGAALIAAVLVGAVAGVTNGHISIPWLPIAAATLCGYVSHLAIDALNVTPMPLFWPVSRRTFRSPTPPLPQNSFRGQLAEAMVALLCMAALVHCLAAPASRNFF